MNFKFVQIATLLVLSALAACGDGGKAERVAREIEAQQLEMASAQKQADAKRAAAAAADAEVKAAAEAAVKAECLATLPARHATAKSWMAKKQHKKAFDAFGVCGSYIAAPDVRATFNVAMTASIADLVKSNNKSAASLKTKKKSEGVSIGMSQQDVLDSVWGKPRSVNRTTTAYGVREQWIYGGSNYLYFEDGVLVAMQN